MRLMGVLLILLLALVPSSATTLELWVILTNEQAGILQDLVDEHFTPRTGITVETEIVTFDQNKYILAVISNDAPDIGLMGSLGPADMGVRGAVVDLKAAFGQEYLELEKKIFPGLLRSFDFYGTAFGLPFNLNGIYPMYVRHDIMDSMGLEVPATWSDLQRILPRMQAQDRNFGFIFGMAGSTYADVSMFIWQNGGDWYTPDRKASGLDRPEAIAGARAFADLFINHRVPHEVQRFMGFRSGELPLMTGVIWEYFNYQMAAPELAGKWGIAKVPGTPGPNGINHAAYLGGSTLAMFQSSTKKAEAWEFIKWFYSTPIQAEFAKRIHEQVPGSFYAPPNYEAFLQLGLPQSDLQAFHDQAAVSMAPAYALLSEHVTHRYLEFAVHRHVFQGVPIEQAMREAGQQMTTELTRKQVEYARFISRLTN